MKLRFWVVSALKNLGIIVGASLLYGVLMWMQMDDGTLSNLLEGLSLYLILFGALMTLGINTGLYKMSVSLALSFGSTRREALVGVHLYRLIPAAAVTALASLIFLIPGVEPLFGMGTTMVLSAGLFLLCGAFGSVLGMVSCRFGKTGAIVAGIAAGVVCLCGGFAFGFAAVDQSWWPRLFQGLGLTWVFLLAAAAIYAIVSVPEYRFVRSFQVRQ